MSYPTQPVYAPVLTQNTSYQQPVSAQPQPAIARVSVGRKLIGQSPQSFSTGQPEYAAGVSHRQSTSSAASVWSVPSVASSQTSPTPTIASLNNAPTRVNVPLTTAYSRNCNSCKLDVTNDPFHLECLACTTSHASTLYCEECCVKKGAIKNHHHHFSHFVSISDPAVHDPAITAQGWEVRKSSLNVTWYHHKASGTKTYERPKLPVPVQQYSTSQSHQTKNIIQTHQPQTNQAHQPQIKQIHQPIQTHRTQQSNSTLAPQVNPKAPVGWEEIKDPDGRLFYYNRATKTSKWTRPAPNPLPPGWAEVMNPDGRTYYRHIVSNTLTWNRPGNSAPIVPNNPTSISNTSQASSPQLGNNNQRHSRLPSVSSPTANAMMQSTKSATSAAGKGIKNAAHKFKHNKKAQKIAAGVGMSIVNSVLKENLGISLGNSLVGLVGNDNSSGADLSTGLDMDTSGDMGDFGDGGGLDMSGDMSGDMGGVGDSFDMGGDMSGGGGDFDMTGDMGSGGDFDMTGDMGSGGSFDMTGDGGGGFDMGGGGGSSFDMSGDMGSGGGGFDTGGGFDMSGGGASSFDMSGNVGGDIGSFDMSGDMGGGSGGFDTSGGGASSFDMSGNMGGDSGGFDMSGNIVGGDVSFDINGNTADGGGFDMSGNVVGGDASFNISGDMGTGGVDTDMSGNGGAFDMSGNIVSGDGGFDMSGDAASDITNTADDMQSNSDQNTDCGADDSQDPTIDGDPNADGDGSQQSSDNSDDEYDGDPNMQANDYPNGQDQSRDGQEQNQNGHIRKTRPKRASRQERLLMQAITQKIKTANHKVRPPAMAGNAQRPPVQQMRPTAATSRPGTGVNQQNISKPQPHNQQQRPSQNHSTHLQNSTQGQKPMKPQVAGHSQPHSQQQSGQAQRPNPPQNLPQKPNQVPNRLQHHSQPQKPGSVLNSHQQQNQSQKPHQASNHPQHQNQPHKPNQTSNGPQQHNQNPGNQHSQQPSHAQGATPNLPLNDPRPRPNQSSSAQNPNTNPVKPLPLFSKPSPQQPQAIAKVGKTTATSIPQHAAKPSRTRGSVQNDYEGYGYGNADVTLKANNYNDGEYVQRDGELNQNRDLSQEGNIGPDGNPLNYLDQPNIQDGEYNLSMEPDTYVEEEIVVYQGNNTSENPDQAESTVISGNVMVDSLDRGVSDSIPSGEVPRENSGGVQLAAGALEGSTKSAAEPAENIWNESWLASTKKTTSTSSTYQNITSASVSGPMDFFDPFAPYDGGFDDQEDVPTQAETGVQEQKESSLPGPDIAEVSGVPMDMSPKSTMQESVPAAAQQNPVFLAYRPASDLTTLPSQLNPVS